MRRAPSYDLSLSLEVAVRTKKWKRQCPKMEVEEAGIEPNAALGHIASRANRHDGPNRSPTGVILRIEIPEIRMTSSLDLGKSRPSSHELGGYCKGIKYIEEISSQKKEVKMLLSDLCPPEGTRYPS